MWFKLFLLYYYIINQKAIAIQENEKLQEEIKPFKDIISSKFSELGYYVTDVSYQDDKISFWVKYKNSDSINNGYEYKVGVWATSDDKTVEIQGVIKDLRGNEDTRKSKIIKYFDNIEASVLYIKLLDFDSGFNKYTYEVPITFMSISGANRLYWVFTVKIENGDIKSMSRTVINETKYNELAKNYPADKQQIYDEAEQTSLSNKVDKWNSFIKKFKEAVINKDRVKIISMSNNDELICYYCKNGEEAEITDYIDFILKSDVDYKNFLKTLNKSFTYSTNEFGEYYSSGMSTDDIFFIYNKQSNNWEFKAFNQTD